MKIMCIPRITVAAVALTLGACGDLLEVKNPGMIEDEALNLASAVPGLVGGMSGDFSVALSQAAFGMGLMAHELYYSGAYDYNALPFQGVIDPEIADRYWLDMHRARWVAETGIERLKSILGDEYGSSRWSARANLFAGFSNRLLGDNVCVAVINAGPAQPHTVHFERAESYFTAALAIAQAANQPALAQAARAGRASVRASLGKWDEAAQDAAQIPTSFVHEALYSTNTARETNTVVEETRTRFEASVWGTRWAEVQNDPRVPWEIARDPGGNVARGRDGATPQYPQRKYLDPGANIPLVKGTEMLLIRAEAALRGGNVPEAIARINDARAHHGLGPLSAGSEAQAWDILKAERAAEIWLEARRLGDLRRWHAEGRDSFLENRDKCIPVGQIEQRTNPNL